MVQPRAPRRSRRGAASLIVAMCLVVILGMAAIVIDLGYLNGVQAELQGSADAAAHGGALQLNGTAGGMEKARTMATLLAATNASAGRPVSLDPTTIEEGGSGVELGTWDGGNRLFTVSADSGRVNAVRVQARMADLPAMFSQVAFQRQHLAASAQSVAVRETDGASAVDCYLPITTSTCLIQRHREAGIPYVDLMLNPAGIDNVGWGRPAGHPSASWISRQLLSCKADGTASIGDELGLGNGTVTSVLPDLAWAISNSSTSWDPAVWGTLPPQLPNSSLAPEDYGKTFEGPIPLFNDPSYCSGKGTFTGTKEIAGFVWVAVYDVVSKGPVAKRTIRVRMDTTREHAVGTEVDGPDFGVTTPYVELVH